jgi:hypothetical protein
VFTAFSPAPIDRESFVQLAYLRYTNLSPAEAEREMERLVYQLEQLQDHNRDPDRQRELEKVIEDLRKIAARRQ